MCRTPFIASQHHRCLLAALILSLVSVSNGNAQDDYPDLFPFVLPWDDASEGPTNLARWNAWTDRSMPRVRVTEDGHFAIGNRRVRFLGVNLCFGACFPRKSAAERIAARMAKFGINVVRFHHMDTRRYPHGIIRSDSASSRELEPEALDRLDYLIDCLARHGIYTNLNLLVGRRFNRHDGLPAAIEEVEWKDQHVIGFFDDRLLALQKEYAAKLLRHRNRYRGRRYAEDPAIAFVEIINENGLVHAWLGGRLDRIPEEFLGLLRSRWNAWLRRRYRSTTELVAAWRVRSDPLGRELLTATRWLLERHDGAQAESRRIRTKVAGRFMPALVVRVFRQGTANWHIQLTHPGLSVQPGRPYTLCFWGRADRPRTVQLAVRQAHAPWQELGFSSTIELDAQWRPYRFAFVLNRADPNARLELSGLNQAGARFWFAALSLREGGTVGLPPTARLEDGTVPLVLRRQRGQFTPEAQRDWIRFLWQLEDEYWREMARFLREDLAVRSLLTGTIIGCSTPHLQKRFDWIDTHAYWQHPVFPERPWDPENWFVPNLTMVNDAQAGTLSRLGLRRIARKPHAVSEYNHPAPNTYSVEAFPLLAAYAALQDWDAIYGFNYASRADDWDSRAIRGYFTIDQHPGKMVTLPVAAALFRRGDVRPARQRVLVGLSERQERALLVDARPWQLVHAGLLGVEPQAVLRHRVQLDLTAAGERAGQLSGAARGRTVQADTGELLWDRRRPDRGYVLVKTRRTKAIIGFAPKAVDLDGVRIEAVRSMQRGWAVLALSALDGELPDGRGPRGPFRALLVAVGLVQNRGMRWVVDPRHDPLHASLGRHWGGPPTLVEGIEGRLSLPAAAGAGRYRVYALDERGGCRDALPVDRTGDRVTFEIGPEHRTLWYLVELQ